MAALVCDICGGKLVMGQGGVAVCENCGMEHSPERMKEKVQEIKGTVRVDNSHMVDNYLSMAEKALEASNKKEAEDYANKVIEIDPQNVKAWHIKGRAVGWQTTGRNDRFSESISFFGNAMDYAGPEEQKSLGHRIMGDISALAQATMGMYCDTFSKFPDKEEGQKVVDHAQSIRDEVQSFVNIYVPDYDPAPLFTALARRMNNCQVAGDNTATEKFGPEKSDMNRYAWNSYTEALDACREVLKKAYDLAREDDLLYTICDNFVIVSQKVRDSVSYKFEATSFGPTYPVDLCFTAAAKESRTKEINQWEEKRSKHDPERRKKGFADAVALVEKADAERGKQAAKAQYWAGHAAEKEALLKEDAELKEQLSALEQEKKDLPQRKEVQELASQISAKEEEKRKLGLFKREEKRRAQEEIDQLTAARGQAEERLAQAEKEVDARALANQDRRAAIREELDRDRGTVELVRGDIFHIYDESGAPKVTPVEFLQFCGRVVLPPYSLATGTEEDLINHSKAIFDLQKSVNNLLAALGKKATPMPKEYVDDPDEYKIWRFAIKDKVADEKSAKSVSVYVDAKSIHEPIKGSVRIEGSNATQEAALCFASVAGCLLYNLCGIDDLTGLQKLLLREAYRMGDDKGGATLGQDDLVCKFSGTGTNITLTITCVNG